jgi:hypothetical protein
VEVKISNLDRLSETHEAWERLKRNYGVNAGELELVTQKEGLLGGFTKLFK